MAMYGYNMLQHNGSSGEKNTMGKQWYLLATILLRQTMRSGSVPAGWWLTYPSEKYESQLGWFFPLYGKIIQMFQTFPNHQPEWVLQIFWGKTHHVACRSWFHLRCHARLQRGITTRAMRMVAHQRCPPAAISKPPNHLVVGFWPADI